MHFIYLYILFFKAVLILEGNLAFIIFILCHSSRVFLEPRYVDMFGYYYFAWTNLS